MTQRSILIADDDRDLVHDLSSHCRGMGLNTYVAHDAKTTLEMVHEHVPSIACLGTNLPCDNELSVFELIVEDAVLAKTPVIMLTGDDDRDTVHRCRNLVDYFVKKRSNAWPCIEPLVCEILKMSSSIPTLPVISPMVPAVSNEHPTQRHDRPADCQTAAITGVR